MRPQDQAAATPALVDVDRPATIASVVLLAAVVPAVLLVAPVLVGSMVKELAFTPQQAGYVITAELGAMALATLPALVWMPHVDWRVAVRACLLFMVAGNVVAQFVDTFAALLVVRFVTALAGGSIMLVCMATIGMTRAHERNFGWWVLGQLVVGAIGLKLLPYVLPTFGLAVFFLALVVLLGALLPAAAALPHGTAAVPRPQGQVRIRWRLGSVGLASVLAFYVGLSGVWTYIERIANQAGIDAITIGNTLAIASLLGIAGSAAATGLGKRLGRVPPIVTGFLLLVGAVATLLLPLDPLLLLGATCAFKFAWTFVLPYLLACLTALDPSGRLIVVANLMIGGGLAIGPALAALTLDVAPDYSAVPALGIAAGLLSLILIAPLALARAPAH